MARVRVKINHGVAREILRAGWVLDDVKERVERIAEVAGPGMEPHAEVGHHRVVGAVVTATPEAIERQARDRALTRALDAGR